MNDTPNTNEPNNSANRLTPRTDLETFDVEVKRGDAWLENVAYPKGEGDYVKAEFARLLETEFNEASEEVGRLNNRILNLLMLKNKLIELCVEVPLRRGVGRVPLDAGHGGFPPTEISQLRAKVDELESTITALEAAVDYWKQQWNNQTAERDTLEADKRRLDWCIEKMDIRFYNSMPDCPREARAAIDAAIKEDAK